MLLNVLIISVIAKGQKMKQQLIQHYVEQKLAELGYTPNSDINYVFFWKPRPKTKGVIDEACCCQWWFSNFNFRGDRHVTAEHAMMYTKAKMFNDNQAMAAIREERQPHAAKAIGRQVRNFDSTIWDNESYALVREINLEKYKQDKRLLDWMKTLPANTVFVEASPFDRIWGIGLADDGTTDLTKPSNWQGLNKLGFAITEVFQELVK